MGRIAAEALVERLVDWGVGAAQPPPGGSELLRWLPQPSCRSRRTAHPHVLLHGAAATPDLRHLEWFHDHVLIEAQLFDGALRPAGGALRPDPSAPGHGLTLRDSYAARFRVA